MKHVSEYEQQAIDFAEKNNVKMETIYLGHYPRWSNHVTANYRVTLYREGRKPFAFDFSTSIYDSWQYRKYDQYSKPVAGLPPRIDIDKFFQDVPAVPFKYREFVIEHKKKAPTLYDVLACLTKYDPGTFDNFCADYGYDTDSIKALNTYQAVVKEYSEVHAMFSDVIDELSEID